MAKKNIDYRGLRSTELLLCLLVFFTATLLLLLGKITETAWLGACEASVFAFILGRVGSKVSESYRDAKQPQSNYTPGVT